MLDTINIDKEKCMLIQNKYTMILNCQIKKIDHN